MRRVRPVSYFCAARLGSGSSQASNPSKASFVITHSLFMEAVSVRNQANCESIPKHKAEKYSLELMRLDLLRELRPKEPEDSNIPGSTSGDGDQLDSGCEIDLTVETEVNRRR